MDSLDFLFPHQKEEILWRTATSKESLQPEVSWKRVKLIEKELGNLADAWSWLTYSRAPRREGGLPSNAS